MAGSLDKGASAEKRAKTHHDPIFLDTTAAAHLLAGIRQHLQKAVSLSRAEDEQRKLTNELLRKTRLEAAADAERSNENIGSRNLDLKRCACGAAKDSAKLAAP